MVDDGTTKENKGKSVRARRSKGDGSVYFHTTSQKWRAYVDYGYLPVKGDVEGKGTKRRVRKERSFDKESEAKKWLREQQKEKDAGKIPTDYTVVEWITYWLKSHADKRLRPTSLYNYRSVFKNHIESERELQALKLEDARHQHIQSLIDRKAKEGYSYKYMRLMRSVLSDPFQMAVKLGYIPRNPASLVEVPHTPTKPHRALNVEEAKQLLAASRGDRFEAYYILCLFLPFRRGEALALRWQDVDFERAVIHINGTLYRSGGKLVRGETKTTNSTRTVAMPSYVAQALRKHQALQKAMELRAPHGRWQHLDYVFTTKYGTPIEPADMERSWRAMRTKAKLEGVKLHDLRRSAGSLMLKEGVSLQAVSKMMGHSSIRITGDVYTHIFEEEQRDAANRIDKLLGNG